MTPWSSSYTTGRLRICGKKLCSSYSETTHLLGLELAYAHTKSTHELRPLAAKGSGLTDEYERLTSFGFPGAQFFEALCSIESVTIQMSTIA